ncbi:MAG: hypothetical protein MK135_00605 [Polyangiaceae bacterium]|nr:hypothetical protein [Polyangiaceae bacterium]
MNSDQAPPPSENSAEMQSNADQENFSESESIDQSTEELLQVLGRALAEPPEIKRSLLVPIQNRIHHTTRGRYFRDRFSRLKEPLPLILMASILVLMLAAAIFFVFQPIFEAEKAVERPPSPTDPFSGEIPSR